MRLDHALSEATLNKTSISLMITKKNNYYIMYNYSQ